MPEPLPLAAPPAAADPAALQQAMADLQRSNPQLAMLARLLESRPAAAVPECEDLSDEVADLTDRLADAEARIQAMRRQGRRLFEAHQLATERLADLAAAMGACGLCWGDDEHCPSCRGRGRPGMVRPDMELRARLLGPPRPPTRTAEQRPIEGERHVQSL